MKYWVINNEIFEASVDGSASVRIYEDVMRRPACDTPVTVICPATIRSHADCYPYRVCESTPWASDDNGDHPCEFWWARPASQVDQLVSVFREVATWSAEAGAKSAEPELNSDTGDALRRSPLSPDRLIAVDRRDMLTLDVSSDRGFFVTIQDGTRSGALAGPFADHLQALLTVRRAQQMAVERAPGSAFAEFGTSSLPASDTSLVTSAFNEALGLDTVALARTSGVAEVTRAHREAALPTPVELRAAVPSADGIPIVVAVVRADGSNIEVEFDAARWLSQATDDDICELARESWCKCWKADEIAHYEASGNAQVGALLDGADGFEVWVDEDEAIAWVKVNRSALHERLAADTNDVRTMSNGLKC